MRELPTLDTVRLVLCPFQASDADRVRELAGAREVAETTSNIPHPYPAGAAESWIATHATLVSNGSAYVLAVRRRDDDALLGAMGLGVDIDNRQGELMYWIGLPYWGHGYATEAAAAMMAFGFDVLELNRIWARHMTTNPASGRVMQKLGMRHEGTQRQALLKWDEYKDMAYYSILCSEYDAARIETAKAASAHSGRTLL